jgi:hypothetical protein
MPNAPRPLHAGDAYAGDRIHDTVTLPHRHAGHGMQRRRRMRCHFHCGRHMLCQHGKCGPL